MPREEQYLGDIVQVAEHMASFLTGIDREAFLASELIRSAVLQKLSVIGEASNRVSAELRAAHPEVPWRAVVGMRDVPILGTQAATILEGLRETE